MLRISIPKKVILMIPAPVQSAFKKTTQSRETIVIQTLDRIGEHQVALLRAI